MTRVCSEDFKEVATCVCIFLCTKEVEGEGQSTKKRAMYVITFVRLGELVPTAW